MSDLHEDAGHVRPKTSGFYDGLTVNGIKLSPAVKGCPVYWETTDGGPVHLHVDPDPHLLLLLQDLRRRWPAEHLAEFDAACLERGLDPGKWP